MKPKTGGFYGIASQYQKQGFSFDFLAILTNIDMLPNFWNMTMLTMPSVTVQNRFGTVSRTVGRGEPITVTQYGEPTMMILPYHIAKEALRVWNAKKFVEMMDSMPPSNPNAPDISLAEINDIVHELRP
jgi:antitoxin (DNA-binding transcriptional repressor) of toxin-antitoxin stability system